MSIHWLEVFPEGIKSLLLKLPARVLESLEEVRIREGRPLEINNGSKFHYVGFDGKLVPAASAAYKPVRDDCRRLLDLISNHSLYTLEEELRRGYITIPGGHRIGLAGRAVVSGGRVEHLRDISGFNVRIAREVKGAGDRILPHLLDVTRKRVMHTLILSPPQQGKTTMIRDLARQISTGSWGSSAASWPAMKVGIIDERSEIAGCRQGVPSFDIGPRTDVLDGCPKAEGMMMMLRSMSPDILIVDEIGRPEDTEAISEALHAGVTVIATAHGSSAEDMKGRPALSKLIETGMFERYVVLQRSERERSFRLQDAGQRIIQTAWAAPRGGDAFA